MGVVRVLHGHKLNKAGVLAAGMLALVCMQHAACAGETAPVAAPTPVTAQAWARTQCVAALDAKSEAIAGRIKAGRSTAGRIQAEPVQTEQTGLENDLRTVLRVGAAFIGQAYLDGERDEQKSKALLDQARQDQEKLPATELAARQADCARQGARLLADSNPLSRIVVSRVADKRMKKMLGP